MSKQQFRVSAYDAPARVKLSRACPGKSPMENLASIATTAR